MESIITAFSKPGNIVLDPFAGSGTTGVAARKSGRQFILIEKVPQYYSSALRRLNLT
jgi:site-specific DNA-methyltransferase (adenine-specific)